MTNTTIGIVDYGGGNLHSVANALQHIGAASTIVDRPKKFSDVQILLLPGVGAFGDCVSFLKERGLFEAIQDWLRDGKPYLGICLGYQLLFEKSEESPGSAGLGFFPGRVVRFDASAGKVPHMGWNQLTPTDPQSPLWKNLPEQPDVYFVHSYYPVPADPTIISATTDYGVPFAASIATPQVVATQFHPEKSQSAGLQILRNAIETLQTYHATLSRH